MVVFLNYTYSILRFTNLTPFVTMSSFTEQRVFNDNENISIGNEPDTLDVLQQNSVSNFSIPSSRADSPDLPASHNPPSSPTYISMNSFASDSDHLVSDTILEPPIERMVQGSNENTHQLDPVVSDLSPFLQSQNEEASSRNNVIFDQREQANRVFREFIVNPNEANDQYGFEESEDWVEMNLHRSIHDMDINEDFPPEIIEYTDPREMENRRRLIERMNENGSLNAEDYENLLRSEPVTIRQIIREIPLSHHDVINRYTSNFPKIQSLRARLALEQFEETERAKKSNLNEHSTQNSSAYDQSYPLLNEDWALGMVERLENLDKEVYKVIRAGSAFGCASLPFIEQMLAIHLQTLQTIHLLISIPSMFRVSYFNFLPVNPLVQEIRNYATCRFAQESDNPKEMAEFIHVRMALCETMLRRSIAHLRRFIDEDKNNATNNEVNTLALVSLGLQNIPIIKRSSIDLMLYMHGLLDTHKDDGDRNDHDTTEKAQ